MATDYTSLKGTMTGTMNASGLQTDMEKAALSGLRLGNQLIAGTLAPQPINVDIEKAFAPLGAELEAQQAPPPRPVPAAPDTRKLGLGIIAANLGAAALHQPQLATQLYSSAEDRYRAIEGIKQQNAEDARQFQLSKQRGLLELHSNILTQKLQQEIDNQKFSQADATFKRATAIEFAKDAMDKQANAEIEQKRFAAMIEAAGIRHPGQKPEEIPLKDLATMEQNIFKTMPAKIQTSFQLWPPKMINSSSMTDEAYNALQTAYLSAIEGGGPSQSVAAVKLATGLRDRDKMDHVAAAHRMAEFGVPQDVATKALIRVYGGK